MYANKLDTRWNGQVPRKTKTTETSSARNNLNIPINIKIKLVIKTLSTKKNPGSDGKWILSDI